MEKHCVSLELAKQLKEAGWKKESEFWWGEDANGGIILNQKRDWFRPDYSAPLATEILEELPASIKFPIKDLRINICFNICIEDSLFCANYGFNINTLPKALDKSLPNALAKLWLYLKKEGLL